MSSHATDLAVYAKSSSSSSVAVLFVFDTFIGFMDIRTTLWFFLCLSFFSLVSVIVISFYFSFYILLSYSLISPITVCFLSFLFFTFLAITF